MSQRGSMTGFDSHRQHCRLRPAREARQAVDRPAFAPSRGSADGSFQRRQAAAVRPARGSEEGEEGSEDSDDDPYMNNFRGVDQLVSKGLLDERDADPNLIMQRGGSRSKTKRYREPSPEHYTRVASSDDDHAGISSGWRSNTNYTSRSGQPVKGYWITVNGRRQYNTSDGKTLTGSAAYKAWSKIEGKTTAKKKRKSKPYPRAKSKSRAKASTRKKPTKRRKPAKKTVRKYNKKKV